MVSTVPGPLEIAALQVLEWLGFPRISRTLQRVTRLFDEDANRKLGSWEVFRRSEEVLGGPRNA